MSTLSHTGTEIPRISSDLTLSDTLGSWRARWGFGRMQYTIKPGLYALGNPTSLSPVFVSANYKMSFDRLRNSLKGRDGWILVLDTKGINVWCAAGKGTFGTAELVNRILTVKLHEIVDHKMLIVPQLGAVGVSAHEVKKMCGFRVKFGPVRASDLPEFLENGLKAAPEMREVKFPLMDRLVLAPMEIVGGANYLVIPLIILILEGGYSNSDHTIFRFIQAGLLNMIPLLLIYFAACIMGPVLLPWLPGRAFSAKGFWLGLILAFLYAWYKQWGNEYTGSWFDITGWSLIAMSLTSFIVMNFTGSSTYTSLSGVKREMKIAVPLQISGAVLGLLFWLAGRFMFAMCKI